MRRLVLILCLTGCVHHMRASQFIGEDGRHYWDAWCDQNAPAAKCYAYVKDLCHEDAVRVASVSPNMLNSVPGVDFKNVKTIEGGTAKPGHSKIIVECVAPAH